MDEKSLPTVVAWLAREVARLHALTEVQRVALEAARPLHPKLSAIDFAQIQIDAWQQFYERLEAIDPELAALIDDRSQRAFDVWASDEPFS